MGCLKMPISRQRVRDFYQARMTRDPAIIEPFLDDDVEWSIAGPIDLIPFCGERRGKDAVIDAMMRVAPSVLRVSSFDVEDLLVDGDRAAAFIRLKASQAQTERAISYQ